MRDATLYTAECPQANTVLLGFGFQDEDCLTFNIYTPLYIDRALPVMVFLHGGAFVNGASSQYDGKILSESNAVVVTVNYRLGALGFFSNPTLDESRADAPSGSDGIRDQQLALDWVRDNVAAFGGDRHNVTLFGESAGAISACIHYVAPSSQGLADRVIL